MLRWVAFSAVAAVIFVCLGLGQIVPLAATMQSFCLAAGALFAVVTFSSYDAWETQAAATPDERPGQA